MDTAIDPVTLAKAAALLVCACSLIDAIIWFGMWRDEKRWEYIGKDGSDYCKRQTLQGLVFAAIGAGVYTLIHYYGSSL